MRPCDVPGCRRRYYGRGLCHMHYQRWHKHGEAAIPCRVPVVLLPEIAKLLARRSITDAGCWQWTGGTNGVGYGVVTVRYRRYYVHRLSYQLAAGFVPTGLVIDHLCRNTSCLNPEHLEPVTHAQNVRRSPLVGAKAHCRHGHAFTPENTYVSPAGARQCRACLRRRSREIRARRRDQERQSQSCR